MAVHRFRCDCGVDRRSGSPIAAMHGRSGRSFWDHLNHKCRHRQPHRDPPAASHTRRHSWHRCLQWLRWGTSPNAGRRSVHDVFRGPRESRPGLVVGNEHGADPNCGSTHQQSLPVMSLGVRAVAPTSRLLPCDTLRTSDTEKVILNLREHHQHPTPDRHIDTIVDHDGNTSWACQLDKLLRSIQKHTRSHRLLS